MNGWVGGGVSLNPVKGIVDRKLTGLKVVSIDNSSFKLLSPRILYL